MTTKPEPGSPGDANPVTTPDERLEAALPDSILDALRRTQPAWRRVPLKQRLAILRRFRLRLWQAVPSILRLMQDHAALDVMSAEILPLMAATRFLTRSAPGILGTKRLSGWGRPVWLAGISSQIRHEPIGTILILAPGNYPLMLAAIQTLQAITAGNVVALKPPPGKTAVLSLFVSLLERSGLPRGVIRLLPESCGPSASRAGFDLIILTGSAATGKAVARAAAERMTPTIMELSGADPVFVLPSASLDLVARALHFGMTLKNGHTCIAPRRVFVPKQSVPTLQAALGRIFASPIGREPSVVPPALAKLSDQITRAGGQVSHHDGATIFTVDADLASMVDLDIFAPWLAIIAVDSVQEALRLDNEASHALGASIFGDIGEAQHVARLLNAGTICINDLIVPSADPRLPFGGTKASGWGVTRGREGLLALTRPVSISTRKRAAWHLLERVRRLHRGQG